MYALLDSLRKQYDMTRDSSLLTAIRRVEKELANV